MPNPQIDVAIEDLRTRILDFNGKKFQKQIPAFEAMHRAFGLQNEIATLNHKFADANLGDNFVKQIAELNHLLKNQVIDDKVRADAGPRVSDVQAAASLDLPKVVTSPAVMQEAESQVLQTLQRYTNLLANFANQKHKGDERFQAIGEKLNQVLMSEQQKLRAPFCSVDDKIKALSTIKRAFAECLAERIQDELQKNPGQSPGEILSKRSTYTKLMNLVSTSISLKDILQEYRDKGSKTFDDATNVFQQATRPISQSAVSAPAAAEVPIDNRFRP